MKIGLSQRGKKQWIPISISIELEYEGDAKSFLEVIQYYNTVERSVGFGDEMERAEIFIKRCLDGIGK